MNSQVGQAIPSAEGATSFQGYHIEKVNPQVGHEIPGAEEGAQMMQLTQAQLVQIVSSAVSQAQLTQHVQQTVNNPPLAAVASTAAVQQVQSPI